MAEKKPTSRKKATKTTRTAKAAKRSKAALGAAGKTAGKKPAKKAGAGKKGKTAREKQLTPEQRFLKTERLAYLLAEKDGFARNPTHYWLDAEAEIGKNA